MREAGDMKASRKPRKKKKLFTPAEANAALPLVTAIVQDIAALARSLHERQERLTRLGPPNRGGLSEAYREELQQVQTELERDGDRMREYIQELSDLGIELKDPFTGLIDFPASINGRDVYLCWRMGEAEVAYWHELEAGFAGRQKLRIPAGSN
jgi:hypothetical protein